MTAARPVSDLELVLAFAGARHEALVAGLDTLSTTGNQQDQRLEVLASRLALLAARPSTDNQPMPDDDARTRAPEREPVEWSELVARSKAALRERGIDPEDIDIGALLDPAELADAHFVSEMKGEFSCRLDMIDLVIATFAGLTAAIVDLTVVKIPRTMRYDGTIQEGSKLTEWLREHRVDTDNWMARVARVPYDSMSSGDPTAGLGGRTHRADTFGHDPIIGLVMGVVDILRGTSTGVDRNGRMFCVQVTRPQPGVASAIVVQLAHLLSDVITSCGLPLPGWSLLRLINTGNIDEQTVSELARQMYLRGFDTWHGLTMGSTVAAADTVLRAGWGLRSVVDEIWAARVKDERRLSRADRISHHPRFLAMSLVAHGIAAAANAGKIAVYQGNPTAWNYAEWIQFSRTIGSWWNSRLRLPCDVLSIRSDINLESLLDGWPNREEQTDA